jgi:hypothetical protein
LTETAREKLVLEITPSGSQKLSDLVVVELLSWDESHAEAELPPSEERTQIETPRQTGDGTRIYEDTE